MKNILTMNASVTSLMLRISSQEQVVDQRRETGQDPGLHLLIHHRLVICHGLQGLHVLHDQADSSQLHQHPLLQHWQEGVAVHH